MTSRAAVTLGRKRWKGVSKAQRSAAMRAAIMKRWHDEDCERRIGIPCFCKERRQSSQVPTVGSSPEGGRS